MFSHISCLENLKLNKAQLIDAIVEIAEFTKKDADKALNAVLEAISDSIAKGEDVIIANFGSFKVKSRQARRCINPSTKEQMEVPARNVVTFSPGKLLKETVPALK